MIMKKVFIVLFAALILLSGCSQRKSADDIYDELFDDYTAEVEKRIVAETKYDTLCEQVYEIYDQFLIPYYYFHEDEERDISRETAIEYLDYVHNDLRKIVK
jgi:uncharacterized protein YceK